MKSKKYAKADASDRFPVSSGARWSLWIMILGLLILVGWASIGKVSQVTRAPAQIISVARTQVIQSPDGGVISKLHVQEGSRVHAGQVLVSLEKERTIAAVKESQGKVAALRITLARLHAEVYEKKLVFDPDLLPFKEYIRNQTALYIKRQAAINSDIAALDNILKLAQREFEINQALMLNGDVSQTEVLRLERSVADIKAQITNRRNKYFQDAVAELTKAQEDLASQTEQLRDRSQLLEHTELTAPVDGFVNSIRVNTLGGVVRSGDTVMELLSTDGGLIAEAKVSPADIAYVSVGQFARVSIDAYDASIFGAMNGEVIYISPDVLTEDSRQGPMTYYRVRISIAGPELSGRSSEVIELRPGMTASVDIKARERTVLQYLVKPVIKGWRASLGER